MFISNLHATSQLYFSDLKTIQKVFPQVVLFETLGRGNVIAVAVNYKTPIITDPAKWPAPAALGRAAGAGGLGVVDVRRAPHVFPGDRMGTAKMLSDDFAPVEYLDAFKSNNSDPKK